MGGREEKIVTRKTRRTRRKRRKNN